MLKGTLLETEFIARPGWQKVAILICMYNPSLFCESALLTQSNASTNVVVFSTTQYLTGVVGT